MRVYLDTCCINRPFDNPGQARVKNEATAVRSIYRKISRLELVWIVSDVLLEECEKNTNNLMKVLVAKTFEMPHHRIESDARDKIRAQELMGLGIRFYDATHIAVAEHGFCEVLFTTDDRLISKANKFSMYLRVKVINPADWMKGHGL